MVAMRMAVSEELIQRSPSAIRRKGATTSTNAKAAIGRMREPRPRSTPRRQASGSNITAARATRPHDTGRRKLAERHPDEEVGDAPDQRHPAKAAQAREVMAPIASWSPRTAVGYSFPNESSE
jgi:hypothetical protein